MTDELSTIDAMRHAGLDTTDWPDVVNLLEEAWADHDHRRSWRDFRAGFLYGLKAAKHSPT